MTTNNSALPLASPLQKLYKVTAADLPLSCPMPNTPLWNLHPRIFLALNRSGHTNCPYCGAEYILVGKSR